MKKFEIITLVSLVLCFNIGFSQGNDSKFKLAPSLEVAGGVAIFAENAGAEPLLSVGVTTPFICDERNPDRPRWCALLEIIANRIFEREDPWRDMRPIVVSPPGPIPDPWENFKLSELMLGETWQFTMAVGLNLHATDNLNLAISLGGGFEATNANSTVINGDTFNTTNTTAPIITYGATARFGLTDRIHAKINAQAITAFEGNMDVIGPDGSVATFEADNMTTPVITAGLGYAF